mmetsp:Transcript_25164/g.75556  ORF Transcript_25164/g.75556 Transcript_25164/m.75556 type:complete len:351 (-) Transcript_25164:172-1224(-)
MAGSAARGDRTNSRVFEGSDDLGQARARGHGRVHGLHGRAVPPRAGAVEDRVGVHAGAARSGLLLLRAEFGDGAVEDRLQLCEVALRALRRAERVALGHGARQRHAGEHLGVVARVPAPGDVVELDLGVVAGAEVGHRQPKRVARHEMRRLVAAAPLGVVAGALYQLVERHDNARRRAPDAQEEDRQHGEEVREGRAHVAADQRAARDGQGAAADEDAGRQLEQLLVAHLLLREEVAGAVDARGRAHARLGRHLGALGRQRAAHPALGRARRAQVAERVRVRVAVRGDFRQRVRRQRGFRGWRRRCWRGDVLERGGFGAQPLRLLQQVVRLAGAQRGAQRCAARTAGAQL